MVTLNIKITLDDKKIRLYLEGNEAAIKEIQFYLEKKYHNIDEKIIAEEKANQKKAAGYFLENYSLAYSNHSKTALRIEAWLPIKEHFTDLTLAKAVDTLVSSIRPALIAEVCPANMRVSELKNRQYVTVCNEKAVPCSSTLKLITHFESIMQEVRAQVGLANSELIPSKINVAFDATVNPAAYQQGLKVFGLKTSSNVGELLSNPPLYSLR